MSTIVAIESTTSGAVETLQSQVTDDGPFWWRRIYGSGVIVSGDGLVMAVGSDDYEDPTGTGTPLHDSKGRVYIYAYSGGSWSLREILVDAAIAYDCYSFGSFYARTTALDFTGTKLVVAATGYRDSNFANLGVGRIFTYTWNGSNYIKGNDLPYPGYPDVGQSDDRFGKDIAMSSDGTVLVVGLKDWGITANNITGYLRKYNWNGGTSSWDFDTILKDVDSGPEEWGGYPSLNADGTFLLTLNDAAARNPVFLEDTGSGLQRVAHTVQWAANSTQTRLLRAAMREDAQAFWGWYNTTDGWREFTRSGTVWVQSEEKLDVTNFSDTSPEVWPHPNGTTVYVADSVVSPIGDANYKGNVWEVSYVQEVLSTCYEKVAEYGIIDYLCVEAPPPPVISSGTPTSLPRPPTPTATPTEPASEYPYRSDCGDLLAAWTAAKALSDNPTYQGFIDESIASGQIYTDSSGNSLCR